MLEVQWNWFVSPTNTYQNAILMEEVLKTKKKSDLVSTCYRFCQWPTIEPLEPPQKAHKQGRHGRNEGYTGCNHVLLCTQTSLTTVTSKCLICSNRNPNRAPDMLLFLKEANWPLDGKLTTLDPFCPGWASNIFSLDMGFIILPTELHPALLTGG